MLLKPSSWIVGVSHLVVPLVVIAVVLMAMCIALIVVAKHINIEQDGPVEGARHYEDRTIT